MSELIALPLPFSAIFSSLVFHNVEQVLNMVELHRLDGGLVMLNSDLIEYVECVPDTIITLTSGNKFIVRESVPEVKKLVTHFQQMIHQPPSLQP